MVHYFFLGIFGIIVLIVVILIVTFNVGNYYGLHYKGANRYYFAALKEGNGKETVYWAKRVLYYTNNHGWTNLSEKLNKVAEAYELNNEQNKSQKIYDEIEEIDNLFKQGKVREAKQRIIEVRHRVVNE